MNLRSVRLRPTGPGAGHVVQWIVGLGVAAGFLAYVAGHVGGATGRVVLHVMEPGLEVTVGPVRLTLEAPTVSPTLLDLPPGRHDFRVRRGDVVLIAETFDLPRGGSTVLVAQDDRSTRHASPAHPASPTGRTD